MPKINAKKSMHEKEFLKTFVKHVVLAKEKIKGEKEQKKREKAREASEKRIEKIKEKIRTAVLKEKKAARKKIEELALEKEAGRKTEEAEKKIFPAPKPTPSAVLPPPTVKPILAAPTPPIYRRALPALPKPPKLTPAWPLPAPPKVPAPKATLATAIDLGKLNPLIQEASISIIQCEGSNLPVKITKEGKVLDTVIKLTETEIKDIIYKFSARAGLALTEPVFKATIGNLTITAVISAFAGSKFVISKG